MDKVSKRQLERFPIYLKYLLLIRDTGVKSISAPTISRALRFSEEQVRKDLQVVSHKEGKPKLGRDINNLIREIENFLGYNASSKAVVIGTGHLGQAFLNYVGFEDYGLNILAGFDVDPKLIGQQINHKHIYDMSELENIIPLLNVKIAILTVPTNAANTVAKRLIKCGIKAIWNFVPIRLDIKDDIVVENVNLASSLAVLSHKLHKGE